MSDSGNSEGTLLFDLQPCRSQARNTCGASRRERGHAYGRGASRRGRGCVYGRGRLTMRGQPYRHLTPAN